MEKTPNVGPKNVKGIIFPMENQNLNTILFLILFNIGDLNNKLVQFGSLNGPFNLCQNLLYRIDHPKYGKTDDLNSKFHFSYPSVVEHFFHA